MPGLADVRLQLADDVLETWRATQLETGDPDTALPYWAVAWAGGLAIAAYLQADPAIVRGRRVLDLAAGSGLCAIVAMQAGAVEATAVDIDPFAIAVIELNARANGVVVEARARDALDDLDPPNVDVVLCGDAWYEAGLAARVTPWLRRARDAGIEVLLGDHGRRYLPIEELEELATYDVRTTTELEDLAQRTARVFRLRDRRQG